MGFQPFGYRFEVTTNLNPTNAKKAIQATKTDIFDPKNGARGWVAGPFICLWFSPFDQYGPMLFGLISPHNFGARVHGRAGSDLNGVLMFTLLIPLMAWLAFVSISEGEASIEQLLWIGAIVLVGGPLFYWSAHRERKDAEPLVRFLRKTLSPAPALSRSAISASDESGKVRLLINGDRVEGGLSSDAIEDALMRVGNGDFLIIETTPQEYIQTLSRQGAYILEARKGGPAQHYRATRVEDPTVLTGNADDHFTFEEVQEALTAYVSGLDMPGFIRWQLMDLKA
ncbi:hypothetical protein [Sphingomonas mesophila]|uniref:hypothetical protein n=1 Tax=Sphingomonas mesophila TaxID=2303576 RepID=UPI000E56EDE6|nr:hypothetical protein [Sphingomonas mesophila]